jgi:hypothetical protein
MNKLFAGLLCVALLGITLSFIGSTSVTAKRAIADKGTGCYVKTGEGESDYVVDPNCQAHDVLKMDDDGGIDFYVYQDHGQTSWHPEETYRTTYDASIYVNGILVEGVIKETVTPSGEYKSSFKSY